MDGREMRWRYTFYGEVQGVGFRYRAKYAAAAHGISGWVENLPDGSVAMEAQGRKEELASFLAELRSGAYIDVRDMESAELSPRADERGFRVRGY